jgi:predicted alpha/beta superfamily hydrolase
MQAHQAFRRFVSTLAVALVLGLAACGGGGGGGGGGAALPILPPTTGQPSTPPPTSAGQVIDITIKSDATGASYPIQVYLPAGYASATKTYPTMYVTDGDATFNLNVSRFRNFVDILEKQGKKAIVVGIGGTARRNTDYLPPGSTAYHGFLVRELVPYIEAKYRADPARRMLSGLSNGGVFVLSAFLLEGASQFSFQYFFSSEAPVNTPPNDTAIAELDAQMYAASGTREVPVTLWLAYGINNTGGPIISAMYDKIAAHKYKGLQLSLKPYPGGHTPMDLASFEDIVATFTD